MIKGGILDFNFSALRHRSEIVQYLTRQYGFHFSKEIVENILEDVITKLLYVESKKYTSNLLTPVSMFPSLSIFMKLWEPMV